MSAPVIVVHLHADAATLLTAFAAGFGVALVLGLLAGWIFAHATIGRDRIAEASAVAGYGRATVHHPADADIDLPLVEPVDTPMNEPATGSPFTWLDHKTATLADLERGRHAAPEQVLS